MQEEMLEFISAICKVTLYLKHELSWDPHKLCVSLSKLQACREFHSASMTRGIGFVLNFFQKLLCIPAHSSMNEMLWLPSGHRDEANS